MATLDGQPVSDFRYDKVRALLAYLAVESDRSHRREHLCDLLWPDSEPELARQNLSQALYCLRQLFGGVHGSLLLADRHEIGFNVDSDYWLDVAELGAAFEEGACNRTVATMEHWERVVALYRGEFLEGFSLPDAAPFDEWVLLQREWLLRLVMDMLRRLVVGWRELSSPRRALDHAWHLAELEPWAEDTHRQIMSLLVECDRPGEALVQYEHCRHILRQELGVEPQPQTTALYKAIQDGQIQISTGTQPSPEVLSCSLPVPTVPLIGREQELALIARRLADPNCRLLTITGPGGIGKTRLAYQVALDQTENYAHGVHVVDLSLIEDKPQLSTAILQALHATDYSTLDPQRRLLAYLRDKEMLLLLDNFEHHIESVELLSHVLQAAPALKLLITSRERLKVHQEWLLPLEGLALPLVTEYEEVDQVQWCDDPSQQTTATDDLECYGAIQLFLHWVRHVYPGHSPAPEELAHIAHICQLLEGIPLAIELAAAWARILTYEQIAQGLEDGLALLATDLQDVPVRHRNMSALFDHSWQLLSARQQELLSQLTVLRGSFSCEDVAAVTQASLYDLARLVDASWIRAMPNGHFRMYELIRKYCKNVQDRDQIRIANAM
ncbi:MAG: ATP-binding protein [Caldilineaceae bacterium]